jgi:hypothetical protein
VGTATFEEVVAVALRAIPLKSILCAEAKVEKNKVHARKKFKVNE